MKKVLSRLSRAGRPSSKSGETDACRRADATPVQGEGGRSTDGRPASYDLCGGRALTGLQQAVWDGDLTRFSAISGPSAVGLLARDAQGRSLLHLAAARGHHQLAAVLLDRNLPLDARDADGNTPLIKAVEVDSAATARLLLERGADANVSSSSGGGALHVSLRRGCAAVTDALLEHGADVHGTDQDGRTPLHTAILHDNLQAVQVLLSRGAAVSAADRRGRSVLHAAAAAGYRDLVLQLLEAGADPTATDANGCTAGELAAKEGFPTLQTVLEQAALKRSSNKSELSRAGDEQRRTPTLNEAQDEKTGEQQRTQPGAGSPALQSSTAPEQAGRLSRGHTSAPSTRPAAAGGRSDSDSWSDDDPLDFAATKESVRPLPSCFSASPPGGVIVGSDVTTGDDVTNVHVSGVQRLSSADERSADDRGERRTGDSPRRTGLADSWTAVSPVPTESRRTSWSDSDSAAVSQTTEPQQKQQRTGLSGAGGPTVEYAGDEMKPRSQAEDCLDMDDSWGSVSPIKATPALETRTERVSSFQKDGLEENNSWSSGSPAFIKAKRDWNHTEDRRSSALGSASPMMRSVEKIRGVENDAKPGLDDDDSWGDVSPIMRRVTTSKQADQSVTEDASHRRPSSGSKNNLFLGEEVLRSKDQLNVIPSPSRSGDLASPQQQPASAENSWSDSIPVVPPPELNLPVGSISASNSQPNVVSDDDSWGDDLLPATGMLTSDRKASQEVNNGKSFSNPHEAKQIAVGSGCQGETAHDEDSWGDEDIGANKADATSSVNAPSNVKQVEEDEDSWGDSAAPQDGLDKESEVKGIPAVDNTTDIHGLIINKMSKVLNERNASTPRSDGGKTDSASVNFSEDEDLLEDLASDNSQKANGVKLQKRNSLNSQEGRHDLKDAHTTSISNTHKWSKVSINDEVTDSAFSTGPRSSRSTKIDHQLPNTGLTAEMAVSEAHNSDSWSDSVTSPAHNRTCIPETGRNLVTATEINKASKTLPLDVNTMDSGVPSPEQKSHARMQEKESELGNISVSPKRADSWGDSESSAVSPRKSETSLGQDAVFLDEAEQEPPPVRRRLSKIDIQPVTMSKRKSSGTLDSSLTRLPASRKPSVVSLTMTEPVFQQQQQPVPARPPLSRMNSWCEDESACSAAPLSISPRKPSHQDEPLREEDLSASSWDSSSAADDGRTSARLGSPTAVHAAVAAEALDKSTQEESSWGDNSSIGGAGDSPAQRERGASKGKTNAVNEEGDSAQSPAVSPVRQSNVLDSEGNAADEAGLEEAGKLQLQLSGSLSGTLGREGTLLGCDEVWAGNDTLSPSTASGQRRRASAASALRRSRRRVSVDIPPSEAQQRRGRSPPARARRSSSASVLSLGQKASLLARTGRRLQSLTAAVLAPLRSSIQRRRSLSPHHRLPAHRRHSHVSIDSFLSERGLVEPPREEELTADDELEDMYQQAAHVSLQLGDGLITSAQLITSPAESADTTPQHDDTTPPERPPRARARRSRSVDAAETPPAAEWRHMRLSVSSLADIAEEDGSAAAAAARRRRGPSGAGKHRTVSEGGDEVTDSQPGRGSDSVATTAKDDGQTLPSEDGYEITVAQQSKRVRPPLSEVQGALVPERSSQQPLSELHQQLQCELADERSARDDLQQQLTQTSTEREQLQQQLTQANTEREQLQQQLTQISPEREQLQQQLTQIGTEREQLQQQLTQTTSQQEQLQQQLTQTSTEREQLQQQLTQTSTEREQLQQQLTQTSTEREQLQRQLTQSAAELENLQSTVTDQQEKLSKIQSALESSEAAAAHAQEQLQNLTADSESKLSAVQVEVEAKLTAVRSEVEIDYRDREEKLREEVKGELERVRTETRAAAAEEMEAKLAEATAATEQRVQAAREDARVQCRRDYDAEVATIRSELESQVAALKEELDSVPAAETNQDIDQQLAALRAELEAEHAKQNDLVRNAVEKLKAKEKATLEASHKEELLAREAEFENKVREVQSKLQKEWQDKLDSSNKEALIHDTVREQLRKEIEEELKSTQGDVDEMRAHLREELEAEFQAMFNQQISNNAKEIQQLRKQVENYEDEIVNLGMEADAQKKALQVQITEQLETQCNSQPLKFEGSMDDLRREIEDAIKTQHVEEVSALQTMHAKEIEELKLRMETENQRLMEERIAEVRKDVDVKISTTLDKAEATLNEMKDNIEKEYQQQAADEIAKVQKSAEAKIAAVEKRAKEEHEAMLTARESKFREEIGRLREAHVNELEAARRSAAEAEATSRQSLAADLAQQQQRSAAETSALRDQLEALRRRQTAAGAQQAEVAEYEQQLAEIRAALLQVQAACQEEKEAAEHERLRHVEQLSDRETALTRIRTQHQALTRQVADLNSDLSSVRADLASTEGALNQAATERDTWRTRCREAESELAAGVAGVAAGGGGLQRRSSAVQTEWPQCGGSPAPLPSPRAVPTLLLTVPQPDGPPHAASPRPTWQARASRQPVERSTDATAEMEGGTAADDWAHPVTQHDGAFEKKCADTGSGPEETATVFGKFDVFAAENCAHFREDIEQLFSREASRHVEVDDRPFSVLSTLAVSEVATQTSEDEDPNSQAANNNTKKRLEQELTQQRVELRTRTEEVGRLRRDLTESCSLIEQLTRSVHAARESQASQHRLQQELATLKDREERVTERHLECSSELLRVRAELSESRAANDHLQSLLAAGSVQGEQMQARLKDLTFSLARAELRNQVTDPPIENGNTQHKSPSERLSEVLLNGVRDNENNVQQAASLVRFSEDVNCGKQMLESSAPATLERTAELNVSDGDVITCRRRNTPENSGGVQCGEGTVRHSVSPAATASRTRVRCARQVFPEDAMPAAVFPDWSALPPAAGDAELLRLDELTTSEGYSDDAAAPPPALNTPERRACSHSAGSPPQRDAVAGPDQMRRLASVERAHAETARRLAAETSRCEQLQRQATALRSRYRQHRQLQQQSAAEQQLHVQQQLAQLQETVAQERSQRALLQLELERLRGAQQQDRVLAELRRGRADTCSSGGRLTETDVRRLVDDEVARIGAAGSPGAAQRLDSSLHPLPVMSTPIHSATSLVAGETRRAPRAAMPLLPELRCAAVMPDFRAMAAAAAAGGAPAEAGGAEVAASAEVVPSEALCRRLRLQLQRSLQRHLADGDGGATRRRSTDGGPGSVASVGSATSRTCSSAHAPDDDPVDRSQRDCLATVVSLYSL